MNDIAESEADLLPDTGPEPDMSWSAVPSPVLVRPSMQADSGTTTFLALYLILLTFFMVLASQSEPSPARARAVIDGLRLAFPSAPAEPVPMAIVADRAEQELGELFRHEIASENWTVVTRDGVIELGLPGRYVFEAETAVLQTRRLSMLRRLADAVDRIAVSGDLVVRMSLPDDPSSGLGLRRAAALARDVVRQGFAPGQFEVALGGADPGRVTFTLFRRQDGRR